MDPSEPAISSLKHYNASKSTLIQFSVIYFLESVTKRSGFQDWEATLRGCSQQPDGPRRRRRPFAFYLTQPGGFYIWSWMFFSLFFRCSLSFLLLEASAVTSTTSRSDPPFVPILTQKESSSYLFISAHVTVFVRTPRCRIHNTHRTVPLQLFQTKSLYSFATSDRSVQKLDICTARVNMNTTWRGHSPKT